MITGGLGHIGSHLVPELLRLGHRVRVFSAATPRNRRAARAAAAHGVEVVWGDVCDGTAVTGAVKGVDAVVHLAAMLPPTADDHPEAARVTNVDGTAAVIAACQLQPTPPRLLFTSSFDVHGNTLDRPPPRRVDDPLVPTNTYAGHKIEGERMVRASGLTWLIVRLADVPILGMRRPPRIMFDIGPDNRIETIHAADVALGMANALAEPRVWGRVFFLGGGASCQLLYRDYVSRMLAAMGIDALPDEAFASGAVYPTDWLDTAESQELLRYQRHSFDDITAAVAASAGWRRPLVAAVSPLARAYLLRMSPYYRARTA
jgi:UDP-glucose 4-epimerase